MTVLRPNEGRGFSRAKTQRRGLSSWDPPVLWDWDIRIDI